MPDKDIRYQAAERMAAAEYTRLTELPGMMHPAWSELPEIVREEWRKTFDRHVDALGDMLRPARRVLETAEDGPAVAGA